MRGTLGKVARLREVAGLRVVAGLREVVVSEICEILSGWIVVATFDFTVALADRGMDGLMSLSVDVTGEAVRRLASGTGEASCLAGVFLKIRGLVHGFGC